MLIVPRRSIGLLTGNGSGGLPNLATRYGQQHRAATVLFLSVNASLPARLFRFEPVAALCLPIIRICLDLYKRQSGKLIAS